MEAQKLHFHFYAEIIFTKISQISFESIKKLKKIIEWGVQFS